MPERHFVKYTFLKVDPAWRRLDADRARRATSGSSSPPARTSPTDHLLQAFSLVGHARRRRPDAASPRPRTSIASTSSTSCSARAGLMKWCSQPYSFLGHDARRRSTPTSQRLGPRARSAAATCSSTRSSRRARGTRCPPTSAGGSCRSTSASGASTRRSTTTRRYSFGLDDQEFVVAFDTDDAGRLPRPRPAPAHDRGVGLHAARHAELHLHRHLGRARAERRSTASRSRAALRAPRAMTPPRLRRGPRHHGHRRRPGRPVDGLLGRHARGQLADHRLAARARRPAHDALPGEVDLRRARPPADPGQGPRRAASREQTLEQFDVPVHLETTAERDLVGGRPRRPAHRPRRPALAHGDRRRRPRRLRAQEAARLRHDRRGRAAAPTTSSAPRASSRASACVIIGGGDSACDWVVNLLDIAERVSLVHRREGFRAHEATVKRGHGRPRRGAHRPPRPVPGQGRRRATAPIERVHALPLRGRGPAWSSVDVRRVLLQLGFKTALGPLKEWGFEVEKGAICVDPLIEDVAGPRLGVRRHHDLRRQAQADRHRLRRGRDRRRPGRAPHPARR